MYSPYILLCKAPVMLRGTAKEEGKIFKVTFHDTFRSPCITRGNEIESDAPEGQNGRDIVKK